MLPQQFGEDLVDLLQGEFCGEEEDDLAEVVELVALHDPLAEAEDMREILLVEAGDDDLVEDVEPDAVAPHHDYLVDVLAVVQHLRALLVLLLTIGSEDVLAVGVALQVLEGRLGLADALVPHHQVQRHLLRLYADLGDVLERVEGVGEGVVLGSPDADDLEGEDHLLLLLVAEVQDLRAWLLLPKLALLLDPFALFVAHLQHAAGGRLLFHHWGVF